MLKRCSRCRIEKALAEFPGNRSRPDGLDRQCRPCVCERTRRKRARYLARGCCADCGQPRGDLARRWFCAACARKPGRGTIASREFRLLVLRAYSQAEPSCACCQTFSSLHLITSTAVVVLIAGTAARSVSTVKSSGSGFHLRWCRESDPHPRHPSRWTHLSATVAT